MTSRTGGRAENVFLKMNNALESDKIEEFLSSVLSELSHFAPEDTHPDEWKIIQNGMNEPYAAMQAVYGLVCQNTDRRLSKNREVEIKELAELGGKTPRTMPTRSRSSKRRD